MVAAADQADVSLTFNHQRRFGKPYREAKALLDPGETARVAFEVDATQLAYHDRDMDLAVEAGPYEFRVGHSAADIVDTAAFEVTGTKAVPENGRTYFTEMRVADDA
jgi:beta-glucosidase